MCLRPLFPVNEHAHGHFGSIRDEATTHNTSERNYVITDSTSIWIRLARFADVDVNNRVRQHHSSLLNDDRRFSGLSARIINETWTFVEH